MGKPTLGYWHIRGLAQPIRYLLEFLDVEYDERLYEMGPGPEFSREDWLKEKFTLGLDFPNVPYWIDGSFKLTETRAIVRHIAREKNPTLIPIDIKDQALADMCEGFIWDLWFTLIRHCYDYTDESAVTFDKVQPEKLQTLSKFLGDKQWMLGDKISYLDFILYEVVENHKRYKNNFVEAHPNLVKYLERFEALPAMAKYMKSPKYISGPCYSPMCTHNL